MTCPKCKSQLPAGAISCPKCGTRFKTKQCPYCKSAILFSATKCPRCGRALVQQAAAPAQYASVPNSQGGGFRWWYILIAAGIFVLGIVIGAVSMRAYIRHNVVSAIDRATSALDNLGVDKSSSSSEAASTPEESQAAPASGDSGNLGDYAVSILDLRKSTDYEGKPVAIVRYSFTNNSTENKNFALAVSDKAFQNGVQLESAFMAGSDDAYNAQNSLKDIQPGATLEVEQAFLLGDETSDITVEVSELISLSDEKLIKTFSLTQ